MDIIREDVAEKKRKKRIVIAAAAAAGRFCSSRSGLSQPEARRARRSRRATIWMDTVKRGPDAAPGARARNAGRRAAGDPRSSRPRPTAASSGSLILPGALVKPDTVLLELSNPELERDALDAESQLRAGAGGAHQRARPGRSASMHGPAGRGRDGRVRLPPGRAPGRRPTRASTRRASSPSSTLKLSRGARRGARDAQRDREEAPRQRRADAAKAQVDVQEAHVEQLKALAELKRSQMDALHVRAGISGVLQELPVQVGQRVTPGTTLAKVASRTS